MLMEEWKGIKSGYVAANWRDEKVYDTILNRCHEVTLKVPRLEVWNASALLALPQEQTVRRELLYIY